VLVSWQRFADLLYLVFRYLLGTSVAFRHGFIPRRKPGYIIAHFTCYVYVLSGVVWHEKWLQNTAISCKHSLWDTVLKLAHRETY